ncbi:MAG: helix-turn-helix transcriptional regulator [Casimicrobium sp.]|jgi:transcriptional regulator with XRE-family HTH domain
MELKGFGARLRIYRMRKGLSLQKLADEVAASKAHIYELETGRSANPSLALLTELSRALEVPIKTLVGESDETSDSEEPELAMLFRDLRELQKSDLNLIQTLTEKMRQQQKDGNKPNG